MNTQGCSEIEADEGATEIINASVEALVHK